MRRDSHLRARQSTVLLVAAILTLAGCGATGDPLQQAVHAANKTLALPGVGYDLTLNRSSLFGAWQMPVRGRAVYDPRGGLGYEKLVLEKQDGTSLALYLDILPTRLLVAPSPLPAGLLPEGKSWISAPLTARADAKMSRQLTAQAVGLTPELALDELAWGAQAVSFAGERVIDHVPMRAYRVSVNLRKALSAARTAGKKSIAAAIEHEMAALGSSDAGGHPPSLSVTAWVNASGYVARLITTVPGSGLGTTSFSFSNFSTKVPRNLPRPEQTVTLRSLGRSLWATATGT